MIDRKYSALASLAFFGILSGGLYALLYLFADEAVATAERVRDGEKLFAGIPIGIAFLFSFVHGTFTSKFWDFFGFRPKRVK